MTAKYSKEKLLKYIGKDPNQSPYKEADLVVRVPISVRTLQRIKSGDYEPSERLQNAIMRVIER